MSFLRLLALVASLTSSSYFAFGNLACEYMGIMPAIARKQTALPPVDRLALWLFAFHVGKYHLGISGVFSALALSGAAYLTPGALERKTLIAGALAAFTSAAYSGFVMTPVNTDLIARERASIVKPMEPKEEEHVLKQLDKWRSLHRVRIALGFVAWMASVAALLASEAMIQWASIIICPHIRFNLPP
ncbi:hypothetical protein C8F04DRAFT_1287848 [Mycena alexandri]|uniref:DUF1772-domain-containing protein n=1 Tax=Mycena alexandri TaxID=1745969 RepID=A0AAD6TCT9_9AGAR|nr:hypothetical protein C8F04DRAFT_1287848 [Mycena alexandri]